MPDLIDLQGLRRKSSLPVSKIPKIKKFIYVILINLCSHLVMENPVYL